MAKTNDKRVSQLLRNIDKRKPPKGSEAAHGEKQRVKRLLREVGKGKKPRKKR